MFIPGTRVRLISDLPMAGGGVVAADTAGVVTRVHNGTLVAVLYIPAKGPSGPEVWTSVDRLRRVAIGASAC